MSTAKFNPASRTANIAAKSVNLTYTELTLPDHSVDYVTAFKASAAARLKSANIFTIDVLPNFTPILAYIEFHCAQTVSALDQRQHGKVTLPTYTAYCLAIIYGHFLISDMYIRPSPSNYANEYRQIDSKHDFVKMLLTLPVPKFLDPILKHFTCAVLPNSQNIVFCPSFAGFDLSLHLGKFYPINIFFSLHDITATFDSRTSPAKATLVTMATSVFNVTDTRNPAQSFNYKIGNFFGSVYSSSSNDPATIANYQSFISVHRQVFDSTFNPVLSRDYTRRSTLAPTSVVPPQFTSHRSNPYDIIFAYSPTNFNEFKIVFDSIASLLPKAVPCSSDLAAHYATTSGIDILSHAYCTTPLPIHHRIAIDDAFSGISPADLTRAGLVEQRQTPTTVAATFHFLVQPAVTVPDSSNFEHATISATCDDEPATHTATPVIPIPLYNLINQTGTAPTANVPAQSAFIHFDEERDVSPSLLALCPTTDDQESAWKTSAFGMIIESLEIDASVVHHPNAEMNSALSNAQFAQSAVPYNLIVRTLMTDTTTRHFAQKRATELNNNYRAATHFLDFSKISVPRLAHFTFDHLPPNGFPGLTFLNNVTWINAIKSFIGFSTISPAPARVPTSPPNFPTGQIYLWSPYSYTPVPTDIEDPRSHLGYRPQKQTSYFISNLRTILGSDAPLFEVEHYNKCIPAV